MEHRLEVRTPSQLTCLVQADPLCE